MPSKLSLFDLTNLSIGTPEVGAVNFNALHTLLHAILKQLNIQEVQAEISDEERAFHQPPASLSQQVSPPPPASEGTQVSPGKVSGIYHQMEKKVLEMERQMEALNQLPTGTALMERSKDVAPTTPVGDMWQMIQMKRKIEGNEDGINKAMTLLQDLLNEINLLKTSRAVLESEILKLSDHVSGPGAPSLQERLGEIEKQHGEQQKMQGDVGKMQKEIEVIQQALRDLEEKLKLYPSAEVMNNMVEWEVLQETLVKGHPAKDSQTSLLSQSPGAQPVPGQVTQPGTGASSRAGAQPGTGAAAGPGAQPGTGAAAGPGAQPVTGATAGPGAQPVTGATAGPGAQLGTGAGIEQGAQPGTGAGTGPGTQPGTGPPVAGAQPSSQAAGQAQPGATSAQSGGSPLAPGTSPSGHALTRTGSASTRYPDTVEALRNIGQMSDQYPLLKELIDSLEKNKVDRSELEQLKPFMEMAKNNLSGFPAIPADLAQQLAAFKKTMEETQEDRQKLQRMEKFLEPMISQVSGGADQKVEGTSQISLQLGHLSATVQDIEKELKELREKQDQGKTRMEQSMTETSVHLQDQLDKLRSILQSMVSSSSTLLSMSMQQAGGTGVAGGPEALLAGQPLTQALLSTLGAEVPGGPHFPTQIACPACSIDVSEQVSQLVSRYEQLQEMVNSFMARSDGKPVKKTQLKCQDGELVKQIQNNILQLQDECEKLNSTTGDLIEDHQQKQRHIDILYQSVEKLEEKKADKDHIETDLDVKADKRALEGKVSRTQFDATNEQLNRMMQDLLNKITGQEQDWQKLVDKISSEMESKLDRLELDPFRHQLEDRWKAIQKQLKERSPHYGADDAAGIRKQLIARFHCLSCDRPVDMMVPGQPIMTVPNMPGLPCHRSNRPHTVYDLEQVRQQTKSVKSGLYQARCDAAHLEKSINQLQSIHSCMRKDIEKVQICFGGSVRASSQAIREILHARCISLGQYRRRYERKPTADRLPERAECGFLASRSCGGSHTLTFPHRRYTRLQNINPNQCVQPEEENILALLKQEEIDILGQDGHIYRGRMEYRFPAIQAKDASKNRGKTCQCPVKTDANNPPDRPLSARTSPRSLSASSKSLKDRPLSSQGRLSQNNVAHPPTPTPPPENATQEPAGGEGESGGSSGRYLETSQ